MTQPHEPTAEDIIRTHGKEVTAVAILSLIADALREHGSVRLTSDATSLGKTILEFTDAIGQVKSGGGN
jgi:hypothetical protein